MHPLWRRRATCAAVAAGSAFSVDRLTNGGFRSLALVAGVGFAIFTNLMIQATTMCVWLRVGRACTLLSPYDRPACSAQRPRLNRVHTRLSQVAHSGAVARGLGGHREGVAWPEVRYPISSSGSSEFSSAVGSPAWRIADDHRATELASAQTVFGGVRAAAGRSTRLQL